MPPRQDRFALFQMFSHLRHPVLRLIAGCWFSAWLAISAYGQTNTRAQIASVRSAHLLPGIVVENVVKDSDAEKAGLRSGDILLSWARDDLRGLIQTPFDLFLIAGEQLPRGAVRLNGLRGQQKHSWVARQNSFDFGLWGIETRPNFPGYLLNRYQVGHAPTTKGRAVQDAEQWRSLALEVEDANPCLRVWLLYHAAQTLAVAKEPDKAGAFYIEATNKSLDCGHAVVMQLFLGHASTLWAQREFEGAEKYMSAALGESKKLGSDNLVGARILNYLGDLARRERVKAD